MRKFSGAILAVTLAAGVPANAAPASAPPAAAPALPADKSTPLDPASVSLAQQILAIGMPAEKRSQMFASVMDSMADQVRKDTENVGLTNDKDLQALVARSQQRMWDQLKTILNAALPDVFDSMARAYARNFSRDDLEAMLAFVKTPAGQHFFERAPLILKDPDVQAANQRMMAQMMTKLPEMLRENKQDIEDYAAKKEKQEKPAAPSPVS